MSSNNALRLSVLLGLSAFALACGEEQPRAVDSATSEEGLRVRGSSDRSGWMHERVSLESEHPLGHRFHQTVQINAPETARSFRIRFRTIHLENDCDFLIVKDEWGGEIERITGDHRGYVSRTVHGNKAFLELTTDESVESWGFTVDRLEYRGCVHDSPSTGALAPAGRCVDLERAIRTRAVGEVHRRFTEGGGPVIMFARAENASMDGAGNGAPAHSETNVQVQGVDEADIVKTDGRFIYTVAGRELRRYASWPVENAALIDRVAIEGWPRELFLLEDGRVVVLSGVQGERVDLGGHPFLGGFLPYWWRPDAFTQVTVVGFGGDAPNIESELLLAGQYDTARRMGSSIRVVLHRELNWPTIRYYPENVEWNSAEYERARDWLEAKAVAEVEGRTLEDWLPRSYRVENGQRIALPVDCGEFFVPTSSEQMGLMAVATVELSSRRPRVQETSLLVDGGQIHQSLESLYVTSPHQWSCWEDSGRSGAFTYVHKLDVSRPDRARYVASGGFAGEIRDPFQLDEYDGYLRVASNLTRWSEPATELRSENRVYVLGQAGDRLDVIGRSRPLAPGEAMYGARFLKNKGFVVTFRQIDPLFTLDLSRPTEPTVVGELKIPGFSTYLHPLDETHLFAIGQDFEPDGTTRNGVALSIFDVQDLEAPRLVAKEVVGTKYGYSEALYEHRAFTMYREPGSTEAVLAIPFTDYTSPEDSAFWASFRSSLKVYRVTDARISFLGELDHGDLFGANQVKAFGWWYQPSVRRGVFIDRYVFAISDAGLRAAPLSDLSHFVTTVREPAPNVMP